MKTEYDVSPERAIALIRAEATALPVEQVAIAAAGSRVLRQDVVSLVDRPAGDDSALDGFACRVADTSHADATSPVRLQLVGEVAAGAPFTGRVASGQAVRIATGGLMPAGADGVVGVEHARVDGAEVVVDRSADAGAVRPQGQDLRAGSGYLRTGVRLDSAHVGLLAAMGHATASVSRRPRVLIIATGSEVVTPGRVPASGQLYDANGPALAVAAQRAGCEVLGVEYAPDVDDALRAVLREHCDAASPPDLVITSGGVSRGEHDVVRDVMRAEGRLAFWRVAVRPGGPTMFGRFGSVPLLGLPGNPVSSLVGFLVFGRAFIDTALAASAPLPYFDRLPVRLDGTFAPQAKTVLHRALLAPDATGLKALPFDNQSSGVLRSLVEADALVVTAPRGEGGAGDGTPANGSAIDLRKHL